MKIDEDNGTLCATKDNLSLPLPDNVNVAKGQNVYYGIRPEHLGATKNLPNQSTDSGLINTTSGVVRVVEPTGPEIHVYSKLAGQDICSISRERIQWEPGDDIFFQPEIEHVHLFDGETKLALQ